MQKHKKYILFQYMDFYPRGGLEDLQGSYDSLDDARKVIEKGSSDSNVVVDRDTWETVYSYPKIT